MKKTLLLTSAFITVFGYSQKILNSTAETYYDEFGNVDYADSTVYNSTASTQGFFNEFKPKFGYDGDIMYFFVEDFIVHCNTRDQYNYQGSFPLTFSNTDTNVLTNGLVTQAQESGAFFRYLYDYDSQGRKTMEVSQFFSGTDWTSSDSTVFEYDVQGNKTIEASYSVSFGQQELNFVDSSFYEAGTNKLQESTSYGFDGVNLIPDYKTIVTWAGNNVDQLDILEGDGTGGLDMIFRLFYSYSGALVSSFEAFEFVNGAPNPTALGIATFTHNAQNDPESYIFIADGEVDEKYEYTYDADGFLVKEEDFQEDANGNLYLSGVTNYNFTSIASVSEVETIEVSIYPNPTTDFLRIKTAETLGQIQVFNMNGQVVLSQNNTNNEIDVQYLPDGTYIIYGQSVEGTFKQTFVKQ